MEFIQPAKFSNEKLPVVSDVPGSANSQDDIIVWVELLLNIMNI